jgi:predicted GNAT superfamily acetyltransferase
MNDIRIGAPDKIDITLCNKLNAIQKDIWGLSEIDTFPPWGMLVIPQTGGIVTIAFDSSRPIGLGVFSPAVESSGTNFLYLTMLGVVPDYQNRGIAKRIFDCFKSKVDRKVFTSVKWTYDPLEANNANLYLGKVGAVVRKYYRDYYGELSGKDSGSPTDRFWAELDLNKMNISPTSANIEIEETQYDNFIELEDLPQSIGIEIPENFTVMRLKNPSAAKEIRLKTRSVFEKVFSMGYSIKGFYRKGNKSFYVAGR